MQIVRITFMLAAVLATSLPSQQTTLSAADTPSKTTEETAADSTNSELKQLRKDVEALHKDVRGISESLKELRQTLKNIEKSPSEFSPVTIRVQTPDGRPLEGVKVEMESHQGQGPQVTSTGTSGDDGLALSRRLPYGDYGVEIKEKSGWSDKIYSVTVEIGRPLELVVNVPDPQDVGTLELTTSLNPDAFGELRFGKLERHDRTDHSREFIYSSPEPGDPLRRFRTFPTVGNGVVEPGVEIEISVRKRIEQPDGTPSVWDWSPLELSSRPRLFVTTDRIFMVEEISEDIFQPEREAGFFFAEGYDDNYYTAGYLRLGFDDDHNQNRMRRLEIPAGDVSIVITRVIGRAGPDARETIVEYESDDDLPIEESVWLEAHLEKDSAWRKSIVDFQDWKKARVQRDVAARNLTLEPGDTAQVLVVSPQDSATILDDARKNSSDDSGDE